MARMTPRAPATTARWDKMHEPLSLLVDEASAPEGASDARVVRSALWAAWGDALGFPTELARDQSDLDRRFGATEVEVPPRWRRRIGGRNGPTVDLPAGTYSDDTQLRLAVSRCLRGNGRFDAEVFARVELPVFLSYQLGAGRGTKAAARALAKRTASWSSNFFSEGDTHYVRGGGNGAAMRVQPHVWAAHEHRAASYLPGLLRDAIVTHGHPRGVLGSAWHALALGAALRDGRLPGPDRWPEIVQSLDRVLKRIDADETLREQWAPRWTEVSGRSFVAAAEETIEECVAFTERAVAFAEQHSESIAGRYGQLAREIGGLDSRSRGSGTTCAALSLWLAWTAQENPAGGLQIAANLLGSDTDTIASLTGALLGASVEGDPPGELQDRELHVREAQRLNRLRNGEEVEDFPHPDPLHWQAPSTLADAVGTVEGNGVAIAGLGRCSDQSGLHRPTGKESSAWQWVKTDYGQNVLVKRRLELKPLPASALPRRRRPSRANQRDASPGQPTPPGARLPATVDPAVSQVIRSGFDYELIGRLIEHFSRQSHGAEKAGVFAALVARASQAESRRRPNGA